jgi:hypothetical protein
LSLPEISDALSNAERETLPNWNISEQTKSSTVHNIAESDDWMKSKSINLTGNGTGSVLPGSFATYANPSIERESENGVESQDLNQSVEATLPEEKVLVPSETKAENLSSAVAAITPPPPTATELYVQTTVGERADPEKEVDIGRKESRPQRAKREHGLTATEILVLMSLFGLSVSVLIVGSLVYFGREGGNLADQLDPLLAEDLY